MIHRIRRALLVLAAVLGLAVASAPVANAGFEGACYAGGEQHCYTVLRSTTFSPYATRINSTMNYQCLLKPNTSAGWSSVQTMWAIVAPHGGYADPGFVETGIWNQQPGQTVTFYWVRHGGSYGTGYQIYETGVAAGANTSHTMRINHQASPNVWTIQNNGVTRGTLSSPGGPIQRGETGGEATTNSGSHNFDTYLLQRVQNAVTYSYWPGAAASAAWVSPPWANPPTTVSDGELQTRKTGTGAAC